ncbi:type VII secretion-associated serine protease mycosin [Streptomyces pathocidini]|uniref:type VII secretion-associated serine protease mycosin n=1 Tax=Streptomyces pathocidini TaxID=1650571 RepID=UPI0033E74427
MSGVPFAGAAPAADGARVAGGGGGSAAGSGVGSGTGSGAASGVGLGAASGVGTSLADGGEDGVRFQVDDTNCSFPSDPIKGTPWSLQRLVLDQLWKDTRGEGVKVAVIDTGVDPRNPQLRSAVSKGSDFLDKGGDGRLDKVGHGTKVAGIIAARESSASGFIGLAPKATIIPVRQNDDQGKGNVATMMQAIKYAADAGAKVINISQDTASKMDPRVDAAFRATVKYAQEKDALIVASAGNNGADGKIKETYPAAYEGVLAVAASDRNNARAPFSQSGEFVGIAAPGIDMVSTVPAGGHCVDQGTSFSAPYVSGVAALIRAKHPDWSHEQVITQIEQTADRTKPGRDNFVGWGVVDPVAALTDDTAAPPESGPTADPVGGGGDRADVEAATIILGESPQQRTERFALYALAGGLSAVILLIGGGVVLGDWRRKQGGSGPSRRRRVIHARVVSNNFENNGEPQHG